MMEFDARKFTLMLYDKGITKKELGKRCGIPITTICSYANGRSTPAANKLCAIAKELNCTVEDLLFDESKKPAEKFLAIEVAKELIEREISPEELLEVAAHLIVYANNQKERRRDESM